MPAAALALVLAAAVLHASWNALAKRGRHHLCFLWWSTTAATVLLAPVTVPMTVATGVPRAAWPYLAGTIVLHGLYFYALSRAYRSGRFSVVYAMARGLGVALVPVLALVIFDERPSPLGGIGIALVVIGIVGFHRAGQAWAGVGAALRGLEPGTWWAMATGLATAAYSLVDKAGVARLHPVPYIAVMFLGMSLVLLPVVLADAPALRQEWSSNWRTIIVAAVMTLAAYLLVLFAFQLSKTAYVVAAREVSIVLSAVIGSVWFKEGALTRRLAAAAVVLAGVACVALAR